MSDNDKIKILQSIKIDLCILKEIKNVFNPEKGLFRTSLNDILSNRLVMANVIKEIYELINYENKLNIEENKK